MINDKDFKFEVGDRVRIAGRHNPPKRGKISIIINRHKCYKNCIICHRNYDGSYCAKECKYYRLEDKKVDTGGIWEFDLERACKLNRKGAHAEKV